MVAAPSDVKAFVLKFTEIEHEAALAAKREKISARGGTSLLDSLTGAASEREKRLQRQKEGRLREAEHFVQAYGLFRRGVALLDEVDLLLHPLKSELNWPLGSEEPLDFTTSSRSDVDTTGSRWRLAWFLLDAVLRAAGAPSGVADSDDDDVGARARLKLILPSPNTARAI